MDNVKILIELLTDKTLSVPMGQVLLFVIVVSICLLVGRHKLGLLVSYSFVLYWGLIFNRATFVEVMGGSTLSMFFYLLAGIMILVTGIIGFMQQSK